MKVEPAPFLVVATSVAFFTCVGLLFFRAIPDESREMLMGFIGVLGAKFGDIVAYHFGSSAGSARKTEILKADK